MLLYGPLQGLGKIPNSLLYISPGTCRIPISPPIYYGSGTWKNSELLPRPWDLGKIPNSPPLYRPWDVEKIRAVSSMDMKHVSVAGTWTGIVNLRVHLLPFFIFPSCLFIISSYFIFHELSIFFLSLLYEEICRWECVKKIPSKSRQQKHVSCSQMRQLGFFPSSRAYIEGESSEFFPSPRVQGEARNLQRSSKFL